MCPKQFTIKDRKGQASIVKNGARSLYYTANAIQYSRGTSKKAIDITSKELIEFVRVVDEWRILTELSEQILLIIFLSIETFQVSN
jgi:hypothetical protein